MKNLKLRYAIFTGFVFLLIIGSLIILLDKKQNLMDPWDYKQDYRQHLDHSYYFTNELQSGSEVTKRCLECHEKAAQEVMKTSHWTWLGEAEIIPNHKEKGKIKIGKKNLINNFCIGIQGNEESCTKCHAGYGWKDKNFDFSNKMNVDCLVCHDWSGVYAKGKAGLPVSSKILLTAAKSVGYPKRDNCGNCHYYGGGGMGVKHGDLDSSLVNPGKDIDIHMGGHGFLCIDCHKTKDHIIKGTAYSVSANPEKGISCTDCHTEKPHNDKRINQHTAKIACQTCHIPKYALKKVTKESWEWSSAGKSDIKEDEHKYLMKKGSFVYKKNVSPEYYWFNMRVERYLTGDIINPDLVTDINKPLGDMQDPQAKIWPFKIHRGDQIYDKKYKYFIPPTTAGEGGYWYTYDWDKALRLASQKTGLPYSGSYGFAKTRMYWPLSHMTSEKEKALKCIDCHSPDSRLPWKELGYHDDPMYSAGGINDADIDIKCSITIRSSNQSIDLPADYLTDLKYDCQKFGTLFASGYLDQSALNYTEKSEKHYPYDIHSARGLGCGDCHYSSSSPREKIPVENNHLIWDPRKMSRRSLNKLSPDLGTTDCTGCHKAEQEHKSFPAVKSHLSSISCQSCHIPYQDLPALKTIDETMLKKPEKHVYIFNGISNKNTTNPNILLITPQKPTLLFVKKENRYILKPFNIIIKLSWQSKKLSAEALQNIILKKDGSYTDKLASLIKNIKENNEIKRNQIVYNTFIKLFSEKGIRDPELNIEIIANPVDHGIKKGKEAIKDCSACHIKNGLVASREILFKGLPENVNVISKLEDENYKLMTNTGTLLLLRKDKIKIPHIMGRKNNFTDLIGLILLVISLAGILTHLLIRIITWKTKSEKATIIKEEIYSIHKRFFHWILAAGILTMIITGINIHFPGKLNLLPFNVSVYLHNIISFLLILHFVISFVYHIFSGDYRHFLPNLKTLFADVYQQTEYYLCGIFKGKESPFKKHKNSRLNPLQQITYITILLFIIPLQAITGMMLFINSFLQNLPNLNLALGYIHNMNSWLILNFLIVHLYLITTGDKPSKYLKAMITGEETL